MKANAARARCTPRIRQHKETRRHDLRQHSRHDRQHAGRAAAAYCAQARHDLRQGRGLQSARLGQGPPRARDHRRRRAEAARSSPARRSSRRRQAIPVSRSRWSARPKVIQFVATMVETFSVERRKIMRALGAKVILTPAAERGTGMVRLAKELAEKHGWFLARQFENPANPAFHRQTTGPEILRDFAGRRLDFWVTGWGTGGTLTGAGEMHQARAPGGQDRRNGARGRLAARGRRMEATQDSGLDARLPAGRAEHASCTISSCRSPTRRARAARAGSPREEGIFVGLSRAGDAGRGLKVAAKSAPAARCCS